ncbi:MAG: hypothetical protein D6743_06450 [Calditrichaeota bacterium]|nr:MAG: hypothetical protein D6743_06450 [Calditrichota bacterium]
MNLRHLSLFLLFVLWGNTLVLAQNKDKRTEKAERPDFTQPLRSRFDLEEKEQELRPVLPQQPLSTQALEVAVDPETYVVGPGDVFQVSIWSGLESTFTLAVNPEGKLVIPTVGVIDVDEKPLAEVEQMVKEAAAQKYLNTQITATLVTLRTFRVHVTGQVNAPGTYEAMAVDRVSDILTRAGGLTNWGSERQIQVKHQDGTVDVVDLFRYKKLGDLEANRQVRGGDVIYVPQISFRRATVKIEGTVNDPGVYQLAENETLKEFLLRVDALNRRADLRGAYIERKVASDGGSKTIPIFPYLDGTGNGHSDLVLQDGDVILVPQRTEDVYVVGAVRYPGPYAYYPNLKAIDYVGFAGSTERAGSLSRIKIYRRGSRQVFKGATQVVEPGDTVVIPQRVQFGVREITLLVSTVTSILLTMKAIGVIN